MGLEAVVLTLLVLALVLVQPIGVGSRLGLTFQRVCHGLATILSLLIEILFAPPLGGHHEQVEWSDSTTFLE